MRIVLRRRFLMIAAACSVSSLATRHACADLFGGDLPLLAAIVTQTTATARGVYDSVVNLMATVSYLQDMAKRLDGGDYRTLLEFFNGITLNFETLTRNVVSMGYRIESLNDAFDKLYPREGPRKELVWQGDLRSLSPDELQKLQARWHDEILASARVAARAQTSLATLERTANEAKRLAALSVTTKGVVGQLEITVQMLSVVSSQLTLLQQSLDAANRVSTTAAAAEAAERALARERARRLLENYTYRGKPNIVLQRFP